MATLGEFLGRAAFARIEAAARLRVKVLTVPCAEYPGPCAVQCHQCDTQAVAGRNGAEALANATRSGFLVHEGFAHCRKHRWDRRR